MKEFSGLVLCDSRSERVDTHVRASLLGGALHISAQDLGPFVEEFWGDLDYEYYYDLTPKNTARLLEVIGGKEDPEKAVLENFGGDDGCRRFREICEENDIPYKFYSYV